MNEAVKTLLLPQEYQAERERLFPTTEALRWSMRQNRAELVNAGALVRPTGHWLVVPDLADRVFMEIGRRRAAKRPG